MAPTPRPAVQRLAALIHAAAFTARHLLIAVVLDRLAAVAHVPITVRVLLTLGVIVRHWRVRKRPA